jgi:hypothetical protein
LGTGRENMKRIRNLRAIDENTWTDGKEIFKFEKMSKVKENLKEYRKKTDRIELVDDDIVFDIAGKGIVLKDAATPPHYWRLTIDATGQLVTTDLGKNKPEKAG